MGFPWKNFLTIILSTILFSNFSSGQIVFKELPSYELKDNDSLFLGLSSTRSIIPLNGKWTVYPPKDIETKVNVGIPSVFHGKAQLVFEKSFSLTEDQINNHNIRLYFLGLNYTADISINNVIIYRHTGGEFPFNFVLPRDILRKDKKNILSVKLSYELDSENTIPLKQRFLFPQNFGGIIRDVYLYLLPNISLSDINVSNSFNPGRNIATIKTGVRVENHEFRKTNDTVSLSQSYSLRTVLISPIGASGASSVTDFNLPFNKEKEVTQTVELSAPMLWSPGNPASYIVRVELWRGDRLIDVSKSSLAIYSLEVMQDSILFNGASYSLQGVTYCPAFYDYGSLASYEQMERDIKLIKETGFNCVRFSHCTPHPYYLLLCERYGLLSFIEIPLSSVPSSLAMSPNFITRSKNYLTNFIKAYRRYSIAALGLGSSFLGGLEIHREFLADLAASAKNNFNVLTYASFADFNIGRINNLDLYGVELLNQPVSEYESKLKAVQNEIGKGRVFISSATYIVNKGNSDGYVNDGSYEAQAKYFEELLEFAENKPLAGYFINSMFDYRGDFSSLIAGYNTEKVYHIGISGEDRNTSRISYKVISAKLHNTENVTIPIGSKKDSAPMMYIIFGLALALFMGVLVNSGRKFREDSSRALLRPYNFFADVRDQRIMSGPHTAMLMIVISAVAALVISNLLSYIKDNIFFERLLLSFGSSKLMEVFSYLSWHPLFSLLWLTIGMVLLIVIITGIIKTASFFVRNKVYLSSVFFTVVWSFLPLVLLIPVGIILYRVLNASAGSLYIFGGLFIFAVWIFYRLIKGVYVIFDVNAGSVYFYSILLVIFVLGGILFYYEINNSVISYIQLTLKQFNPGG